LSLFFIIPLYFFLILCFLPITNSKLLHKTVRFTNTANLCQLFSTHLSSSITLITHDYPFWTRCPRFDYTTLHTSNITPNVSFQRIILLSSFSLHNHLLYTFFVIHILHMTMWNASSLTGGEFHSKCFWTLFTKGWDFSKISPFLNN
jgi:hypothetical protein